MKAKGLVMMGMLAHSGVVQVPSVPRLDDSVEYLTIDSDLRVTGENSAEGSFETNGLFADRWSAPRLIRSKQVKIQVALIMLFIIGCIILAFPVR